MSSTLTNLNDRLTMVLENVSRYEMIDVLSEEYQKIFQNVDLSESTKIIANKLISELTARDIISRMAMLAQKEKRGLKAVDLQRVIAASLRGENFAQGDPQAIEQETNNLINDPGIVQSIQHELKKMKIGFYY